MVRAVRRLVTAGEVRDALRAARARGRSVGFVPTMGSLHAGHVALARAARGACDVTLVSIFVNPTQFGPGTDLERYPRDLAGDEAQLAPLGVDFTFAPAVEELYPPGAATWVEVEGLTDLLDGASRPGYFRGICTVVTKLFQIVQPDVAFFGQKDIQQAVTLRRLARDLCFAVDVRIHATVRAEDGLALSSRNAYLSPADRALAPALYRALCAARARFEQGERDARALVSAARDALARTPELAVDYVDLVALESMQRLARVVEPACLAAAVVLRGTRLIDNLLLLPEGSPRPPAGTAW
jgi:pantoate--beta-alanine ligase